MTRPDIARTTQKLAEFSTNPGPDHLAAATKALSYLKGTRSLALEYDGSIESDPSFQSASDAAFADDPATRRSTEGYLFTLFRGPIEWKSIKQKTVSTSTTEAELLSLSHASTSLLWWQRFFKSLRLDLNSADLTINCDNQQTVRLMVKEAPRLVTKLKHVDIHHHWLREQVAKGSIHIDWIPTSQMPADGFTKALTRQKHENFVRQLNMVDIGALISPNSK
jgi:hypothetical protein